MKQAAEMPSVLYLEEKFDFACVLRMRCDPLKIFDFCDCI